MLVRLAASLGADPQLFREMKKKLTQTLVALSAVLMGYYLLYHVYAHIFNPEAILEAAAEGDTERVRELLDKGVDIYTQDGWSGTALMYAARNCHSDNVALLLDRGSEINEYSRLNRTPLMWAALGGCEETVRSLLNRGADASLKDQDGKTALMIATESNDAEIASIIRAACEGRKC